MNMIFKRVTVSNKRKGKLKSHQQINQYNTCYSNQRKQKWKVINRLINIICVVLQHVTPMTVIQLEHEYMENWLQTPKCIKNLDLGNHKLFPVIQSPRVSLIFLNVYKNNQMYRISSGKSEARRLETWLTASGSHL